MNHWRSIIIVAAVVTSVFACWSPPAPAGGYRFTQAWGEAGDGWGELRVPKSAAVAGDGSVWVVDYDNATLLKYAPEGALLGCWGGRGSAPGRFLQPSRVAVAADGTVYVTDAGNQRVQCFSGSGAFLRQWGEAGAGPGQFSRPRGIAVSPHGEVFVTDQNNCRVQVFTERGEYLRQWGSRGQARGEFQFPKDVALGPGGQVYVVDARSHRVQIFTGRGRWLGWFGGKGSSRGRLLGPRGLGVDAQGHVFVADSMNDRVQEFTRDGEFVRAWGCKGSLEGLLLGPRDIAPAPDGSLVVVDTYNRRLQRFVKDDSPDDEAPVTRCDAPAGWSSGPLEVTLSSRDALSGVAATYASADGGRFDLVQGPIALRRQGMHVLSYVSVDSAGNQERIVRRVFRLDWGVPRVRVHLRPGLTVSPGVRLRGTCTVADRLSPFCRARLQLFRDGALVWSRPIGRVRSSGGGTPSALSLRAPRAAGRYEVLVTARDLAGNAGRRSVELDVRLR